MIDPQAACAFETFHPQRTVESSLVLVYRKECLSNKPPHTL
jgi:hypothetical protein